MKTRGLVLDSKRFRGGAVSPPLSLPDVSRFKNNGTFAHGAGGATDPTWTRLPSGLWVVSLDGLEEHYVDCGSDASLIPAPAYTLEVWVKGLSFPAGGVRGTIFTKGGNYQPYALFAQETTFDVFIRTRFILPIFNEVDLYSITYLDDPNRFYYVVATFDGDEIKLFIDAVEERSDAGHAAETLWNDPTFNVYIGPPVNNWFLTSLIAFPRIYNYALDPTTISKHYEAERRFLGG